MLASSLKITHQQQIPQIINTTLFQHHKTQQTSNNLQTLLKKAILFKNKGKFNLALNQYSKLIQLDSYNGQMYFQRGLMHYRLKQFSESKSDFTYAIQLNHRHLNAYFFRGTVCAKLYNCKEALEDFDTVIQLIEDQYGVSHLSERQYKLLYNVHNNKGNVYRSLNLIHEALNEYNKCIQQYNTKGNAHYNRAIVRFYDLNQKSQSQQDFLDHIALYTDCHSSYWHLGQINLYNDNTSKALYYLQKAVELSSQNAFYHLYRGIAYQKLGQESQAANDFELTFSIMPSKSEYFLKIIYQFTSKKEQQSKNDWQIYV